MSEKEAVAQAKVIAAFYQELVSNEIGEEHAHSITLTWMHNVEQEALAERAQKNLQTSVK
jgi:hypothetical protein